jgi:hypothetical protein
LISLLNYHKYTKNTVYLILLFDFACNVLLNISGMLLYLINDI